MVRSLRKNQDGATKNPLMVLRRAVSRTDKTEANPVKVEADEDKPIIKNQNKSGTTNESVDASNTNDYVNLGSNA